MPEPAAGAGAPSTSSLAPADSTVNTFTVTVAAPRFVMLWQDRDDHGFFRITRNRLAVANATGAIFRLMSRETITLDLLRELFASGLAELWSNPAPHAWVDGELLLGAPCTEGYAGLPRLRRCDTGVLSAEAAKELRACKQLVELETLARDDKVSMLFLLRTGSSGDKPGSRNMVLLVVYAAVCKDNRFAAVDLEDAFACASCVSQIERALRAGRRIDVPTLTMERGHYTETKSGCTLRQGPGLPERTRGCWCCGSCTSSPARRHSRRDGSPGRRQQA